MVVTVARKGKVYPGKYRSNRERKAGSIKKRLSFESFYTISLYPLLYLGEQIERILRLALKMFKSLDSYLSRIKLRHLLKHRDWLFAFISYTYSNPIKITEEK